MARFNIKDLMNGESFTTATKPVADFIENIPIESLRPSPNNKYGIRDVGELAANIEENGLFHNLVVRVPGADGMYEIISGERRYHACKMLYDSGNRAYASLPCKVDHERNDTLAQLRLVFANSTARELTDYEKTYQAGRIKELLLQLKTEGHKFSGRMREIVAEIVGVSPAQVGRMESINNHLSDDLKDKFRDGDIGITDAYELSRLPPEDQATALEGQKDGGNAMVGGPTYPKELSPNEKPPKHIPTNGDMIRMMSNQELAVTLMCPNEMGMADIRCNHGDELNCCECLLNWLNDPCDRE